MGDGHLVLHNQDELVEFPVDAIVLQTLQMLLGILTCHNLFPTSQWRQSEQRALSTF